MPETMPRPSTRKPLTLPRSFSRVLGRLLTLPAAESLPLANSVYAQTRAIQHSARSRCVCAYASCKRHLRHRANHPTDQGGTRAAAPPTPEPEPEPAPPPKPAKTPKLVSLDLAGRALSSMMSELGGNEDGDENLFGDD